MVLTSVLVALPGASRTDLVDADAAYRKGFETRADATKARPHFLRAAELYEAAWDSGNQSPAVAGNMAQARYLASDLGTCIRDYRRGLNVFPHDPDLRAGLAFARDQVPYPHAGDLADAARPRDSGTSLDRLPVSFVKLTLIAVTVAGVGWLTLARAWVSARGGLALVGGAMVVAAAAGGGWLWWEDGRQRAHWEEPTAVIVSAADLRTGNSDEYPRRLDARLPAGAELKILGERGGWLHVELASGPVGWVPKDHATEAP
jgi:hypothetical protein